MTAWQGYVWFLPTWFTHQWWHTDRYNAQFGERVPCTTAQMMHAMQGYFSLNTAYLGPGESRIVGNRTVNQWLHAYQQRLERRVSTKHCRTLYFRCILLLCILILCANRKFADMNKY